MPCASFCQTLLFHIRAGHKLSKETTLTDIHKVFLMLNYYGDLFYGVFGWFGIFMLDTPCRQEIMSYPPPPLSVKMEYFVAACLSGLWPEVSFNAKGRTGEQDGEEHCLLLFLFGIGVCQRLAPGTGAREHLWA